MNRGLWILAAMGLVGVLTLTVVSHSLVSKVSGVEEATSLRETVRTTAGGVLAADPPARVVRQKVSDGKGWMWRIDLPLREGVRAGDALVERALMRIVIRCVETKVSGVATSGVLVHLIEHGGRTVERRFGPDGNEPRPEPPPKPPVRVAPPAAPRPVEGKPEVGK